MTAAALTTHRPLRRLAYGVAAIALLIAAVATAIGSGTGYWQLAAFGLGPDIALLLGIGRGLERGRLHPRAVPLYNLLHRFWLRSRWASPRCRARLDRLPGRPP